MKVDRHGNPVLTQFSEEGFVDCVLRIAEVSTDPKFHTLRLVASHEGVLVGFTAIVMRGIRGGFDKDMELIREHVYRPAVQILSSGPESDRFVTGLAASYGLGGQRRMKEVTSFTGIALHQDDIDMETEAIKIKLFGHDAPDDREEDYCESFFNLVLPEGLVYWNEKDQDYRGALIAGLSVIML